MEKLRDYLLLATQQQQLLRSQTHLQSLKDAASNKKSKEDRILMQQIAHDLGKELSAKRVYDPDKHRELLLFEYMGNLLLRKDQFETINQLYSEGDTLSESKDKELIVQLIMGAGKTKILLPILALKNAKRYNLPMIIVPFAMYETNKQDLQRTSWTSFHQEPVTFDFDRNTPFTVPELRQKLWDLQNCIVDRRYVITTPESIHCLHLKFLEMVQASTTMPDPLSEEFTAAMNLMDQIISLISSRGHALLDEADTILDARRDVRFPIGLSHPVPKDRLQIIKTFYKILWSEPFLSKMRLQDNQQEALSADYYTKMLRPLLAKQLMAECKWKGVDETQLLHFLCGETGDKSLPGLETHPDKDMISLAKEFLVSLIPSTMKKNGNEHYGLSRIRNVLFAIPYKANNTPDERSQFGNVYETLIYSIHTYWQQGLNASHVENLICETQRKARIEAREKGILLENTDPALEFCRAFKVKGLFKITPEERKSIASFVTKDHDARFYWLENFVFPDIILYNQTLVSDAQTFVDFFAHVQGFTGTPWNRPTYHQRLIKPGMEDKINHPESEMAIVDALWRKIETKGNSKIHVVEASSSKEMLEQLIHEGDFDCLIDVGALLKGITNEKVVEEIEKRVQAGADLQGTISFNEENQLVVKIAGMAEVVPIDLAPKGRYRSYYDQSHTTGADIKQRPMAKARLTFAKKTVRDLTQGAMSDAAALKLARYRNCYSRSYCKTDESQR